MKTIQIPSHGTNGGSTVSIAFQCRLRLVFTQAGVFARTDDGDDFTPALVQGSIPAGVYFFNAPNYPVNVDWAFTPSNSVTVSDSGKISVEADAMCTDNPPKAYSDSKPGENET